MLCDFTMVSNQWICTKCGRIAKYNSKESYMPTAKCRMPQDYNAFRSGYIHNEKMIGVGDALSSIIKKIGYNYPSVGKARAKITYLNKQGIEWCENHKELILEWLKQECVLYKIQFLELLGKAIIRLAIKKAKQQNLTV